MNRMIRAWENDDGQKHMPGYWMAKRILADLRNDRQARAYAQAQWERTLKETGHEA